MQKSKEFVDVGKPVGWVEPLAKPIIFGNCD
jgi:hypothetical protein